MHILQKIFNLLTSMKTMVLLILIFAISSGIATFIENDYGTLSAKALVYESRWFEAIMVFLAINLVTNIFRFKMYQKKKLPSLLFHSAFIMILIGAGVTRYVGFEGVMHIREGKSEDRMLSTEAFIQIKAQSKTSKISDEKKITISSLGDNYFEKCLDIDDKELCINYENFIQKAQKKIVATDNGKPYISLVVSTQTGPKTIMLGLDDSSNLDIANFSFSQIKDSLKTSIYFTLKENTIHVQSNRKLSWYQMDTQQSGEIAVGSSQLLNTKAVYTAGNMRFVPQDAMLKAKIEVVEQSYKVDMKSSINQDALLVIASYNNISKEIALFGKGRSSKGFEENFTLDNLDITLEWGSKVITLPFKIKLNEFKMLKYAGSKNPSSYQSDVTLIDTKNAFEQDYSIYMNNTLNYDKYRFFQSSYDMDERGTILSVNNDPGKIPTYIGYFMLTLGLILNILNPNSRFRKLATAQKNTSFTILALSFLLLLNPTNAISDETDDILKTVTSIDKEHANKFGAIIIQDSDGRMKPIDTIANEVLNKTSRSHSILGLNANQVILGMITYPQAWQKINMIKYSHPTIAKTLDITTKKFAFIDAFDYSLKQPYKLDKLVKKANSTKPAKRTILDKDVLKIDERLNILYMIYTSKLLMMFPHADDIDGDKPWLDPQSAIDTRQNKNGDYINELLSKYLSAVKHGINSSKWHHADDIVQKIKIYQQKYGAKLMPDPQRVKAEIFFNKIMIFEKLTPLYLIIGLILLILMFVKLIKTQMNFTVITKIVFGIFILGFLAHSFGLGLRWYVSGHAPWSDGYESMIYIAWAIVLAGILFSKHSILAQASTGILAGVTLFTAHLSWMDPQITNLVPVLKSYWLTLHVSIITASYGFLGLSALVGFITLLLIIVHNYIPNINESIKEATRINEMSMILGLSLLVVGNFLGGVWANESWGRYWGWDPKETWALVSILFYTAVVHLRFIQRFNNPYSFALASTIVFSSIIMTYFGVNYYLSGMHSYAAGDPMPVPNFVYYTIAIVSIVSLLAYFKFKKIKI